MSQVLNSHWCLDRRDLVEWVNLRIRRGDIQSITGNGENGYTVFYWETK